MSVRFGLGAALIAFGHAIPALAEDAAIQNDPNTIIVTATRNKDRLPDVSGTLIFAGKLGDLAVLSERPPIANRNLRLAFAEIPGLLVSEVSNGSWASVSYRGLGEPHESWNMLTLTDAVPVVPDMYSYPAAYFTPPLELVERVEFIRGAAGLLYGPQPGGALNYVMKGLRRELGVETMARITSSSFNNTSGLFNIAANTGKFGWDSFIHYGNSDGPRRANSDSEQTTARLRGGFIGDAVTATLTLDYYSGKFGEPGGLSLVRLSGDDRDISTPRDRLRIERLSPSASLDWQISETQHITARLWYSRFERESWRQAGGSFGNPTPDGNVIIRQLQTFDTAALDVRGRYDFGNATQHSATLGLLAHTSDAPVRVDKGISNDDYRGLAGAVSRATREGDALALFGEVRLSYGDFQIVPGFRLEQLRQGVVEQLDVATGSAAGGPPGGANGVLGNRTDTDTIALWGIGVTWDATETARFVLNASRGFKPRLYNDGVTFQSGVDAAGAFESSYALTVEAGVQVRPIPSLRLDAGFFRVTFDDQVGFFTGPLPAAPPFGAVSVGNARRQNVGSMRNQGVDVGASLDIFGPTGMRMGNDILRLSANVQLLDATFTGGPAIGFTPQYAPGHLARASLAWISGDKRAAVTFNSVGDQFGSDNNSADFVLPGYQVVDASIEWPIGKNLSIGAAINNIFDARYAARARPGAGGGFDPGLPRNVGLSLTFRN